jgi:hypothetical protein
MSLVIKILFLVITMLLVMMIKNPNAMIKGLIKQVGARDEFLE